MKRWLILLSVSCVVFAGVANASVQMGDTEVDLLGTWMTQNAVGGGSADTWAIAGAVGYFVTDNIQVQGAAMWASIDTGNSNDLYAIGGRAKYHFMPTNQLVPYIGGQVMFASLDSDDLGANVDGILWGPVLGARYELNDMNDFYIEYWYELFSGDLGDVIDDGHTVMFGLVHQFK